MAMRQLKARDKPAGLDLDAIAQQSHALREGEKLHSR
jgi:hypothetical protein